MCWLKLELWKSWIAKSWILGSADNSSKTNVAVLLFFSPSLCRTPVASLHNDALLPHAITRKTQNCHTRVPALTCLFALQSAKQISLLLENQVNRTCQRWVVHLKALEDHLQCDKRHETISWPPTTCESYSVNVKWPTVSVTPQQACGRGLMCLCTVNWYGKWGVFVIVTF